MKIYSYKTASSSKNSEPKRLKFFTKKFWTTWNTKRIFTWAFRGIAAGIVLFALLFLYYSQGLPDPNKLLDRQVAQSTKILARDGTVLYEIHGEYKRTLVGMDQIPQDLKDATVAIEDKDFYNHGGIYIRGILRSVWVDITAGAKVQGGSTITQQFVKNAILTKDKSWDRKIREIILAVALEARFSKEDILKLYLNEIPYGRNAYGIEAASQTYFNKPAKDLSLAQSAYLAALPQRTTYYNPSGPHRDALDARKNNVLKAMREQGYITEAEEKSAKEEEVDFSTIRSSITAPHFVLWVQDYLAQKFGEKTLEEGGLKVYTTLDPKLQAIAEEAVKNGAEKNVTKYGANNAALVAIDPKNGQVLAMVGSKDYFGQSSPEGCVPGKNCLFEPNVNVALSQRQPGSSFKPYVYVTAFKKEFGYSPASPLFDVTTNFGTFAGKSYIPSNYNGQDNGILTMRKALAGSLNIPAVKTLALVGVENAVQTARDLGITSPLQNCGLSLVLGGCEVRLIDHVAAFAAIGNMGLKNEKTPILKIEGNDGKVIEEFKENSQQVLDPQAAYELISIMTDNDARSFVFGPSSPLTLAGRTVAAKTGTTQNWHDGWTVGFTPSLAAGVWVGNNDGTLLKKGADGVLVAAPIWNAFMKAALKDTPVETFAQPEGIKKVLVDDASGKLPNEYSPQTHTDTFADYSEPKDSDNVHITQTVDSLTGLPADTNTPAERQVTKVCANYHSEKPDNSDWEKPVLAWAATRPEACNYTSTTTSGSILDPGAIQVSIIDPLDGKIFSKVPFNVTASAASLNGVARMELSIDGALYETTTNASYTFHVNSSLQDGEHTLSVRGVDSKGNTSDTSVVINFDSTPSQ